VHVAIFPARHTFPDLAGCGPSFQVPPFEPTKKWLPTFFFFFHIFFFFPTQNCTRRIPPSFSFSPLPEFAFGPPITTKCCVWDFTEPPFFVDLHPVFFSASSILPILTCELPCNKYPLAGKSCFRLVRTVDGVPKVMCSVFWKSLAPCALSADFRSSFF